MQGEATPNYPAAHNSAVEIFAFYNNLPEREKYLKKIGDAIKRNEALLKTVGKASEIDKLHAIAVEHRDTVLSEIDRREKQLAADQKAFFLEMKEKRESDEKRRKAMDDKTHTALNEANGANARANSNEEATKAALENALDHEAKAQTIRDNATELQASLRAQAKTANALAAQLSA